MQLSKRRRLGHALALGISPEKYYAMKGYKVDSFKTNSFGRYCLAVCRSGELGCSLDRKIKNEFD